jgi:hypothetical protein
MMILRCGNRSAAIPPTGTNATMPTPRQAATNDSAAGSSSMAMT